MIKAFVPIILFSLCSPAAAATKNVKRAKMQFKTFQMDKKIFSCLLPENWEIKKSSPRKMKKGVFGVEVLGPREEDAPVMGQITFYSEKNPYFKDYKDFIERNSRDIFGEKGDGESKYGPVKKIRLNKRFAFKFENQIKEYIEPESKSDEYVLLKEKYYVIPSKKGFHVLHFTVSKDKYYKYYRTFNKITLSFRGI